MGSSFHFTARFGLQKTLTPLVIDSTLQNRRVLVVDDNTTTRRILADLARAPGLQADEAGDAAEGVRTVATAQRSDTPYDLVPLGWKMPSMDGVECARLMLGTADHLPWVLMVTACGRDEAVHRRRERDVAVAAVLTKLVTPSTLYDTFAEAFHRAGALDSPGRGRLHPRGSRPGRQADRGERAERHRPPCRAGQFAR